MTERSCFTSGVWLAVAGTVPPGLQRSPPVISDTGGRRSRSAVVTALALALAPVVLLCGSSMAGAQVAPNTSLEGPTTSLEAPTTSLEGPTTSVTVTNSVFPGVEQSTTVDDPAQRRLRWIIVGLFVLAGVSLIFSIYFWYRTRGSRVPTEVGDGPATSEPEVGELGAPAPSPIPDRLRDVPIWADDDSVSEG